VPLRAAAGRLHAEVGDQEPDDVLDHDVAARYVDLVEVQFTLRHRRDVRHLDVTPAPPLAVVLVDRQHRRQVLPAEERIRLPVVTLEPVPVLARRQSETGTRWLNLVLDARKRLREVEVEPAVFGRQRNRERASKASAAVVGWPSRRTTSSGTFVGSVACTNGLRWSTNASKHSRAVRPRIPSATRLPEQVAEWRQRGFS